MDHFGVVFPGLVTVHSTRAAPTWGPLGRCGVQPRDAGAPQNQLPTEEVPLQDRKAPALDRVRLEKDAQELVDLSASVRTDIEHANQGLLSKDVVEKLKRVEKLSKHLRSELMR